MKKLVIAYILLSCFLLLSGCQLPIEDGYAYAYSIENNYYVLIKVLDNVSGDIVLPTEYQNQPVREIANEAAKDNKKITGITIPYGYKVVGSEAFSGCSKLENVYIDYSVDIIKENAFSDNSYNLVINLERYINNLKWDGNWNNNKNCKINYGVHQVKIPDIIGFDTAMSNEFFNMTFVADYKEVSSEAKKELIKKVVNRKLIGYDNYNYELYKTGNSADVTMVSYNHSSNNVRSYTKEYHSDMYYSEIYVDNSIKMFHEAFKGDERFGMSQSTQHDLRASYADKIENQLNYADVVSICEKDNKIYVYCLKEKIDSTNYRVTTEFYEYYYVLNEIYEVIAWNKLYRNNYRNLQTGQQSGNVERVVCLAFQGTFAVPNYEEYIIN